MTMSRDLLRRRVLPWAVWAGAMGTAAWIWAGLASPVGVAGYVESTTYRVLTPRDARLERVAVTPGQKVRAGDLIATLDDSAIRAELATLDVKRRRVAAKLRAANADATLRLDSASRSVEESVDSAEIALRKARAERAVNASELDALRAQRKSVEALVERRMADRRELSDLTVKHASLKKAVQVSDGLIAELESKVRLARQRRNEGPTGVAAVLSEPLRVELEVIDAKAHRLEIQLEAMSLRAPADGEIRSVHSSAGEFARTGTLVATITGSKADTGGAQQTVFACTNEAQSALRAVGEDVTLHSAVGGRVVQGVVARIDPEVRELPLRCRQDARIPVVGRGVHVATTESAALVPGESFLVEFEGTSSAANEVPAARATEERSAPLKQSPDKSSEASEPRPRPIAVPNTLATRTRFEPSGIVWSDQRDRYIIVSDDTGFPHDETNHAPWLFSMDQAGNIDEDPIVIDGLEELNDLESIAPAPDGGLYLLASQSRNRKGKRSKHREFFGRIELTTSSARVTDGVRLGRLIAKAQPEVRTALGLGHGDEALDIEGMTATRAGGILLGLKNPTGTSGAIVWHMRDPEALLRTGELSTSGLTLWGRLPLSVEVDGSPSPGGIAELLELSDGTLLVAATAARSTASEQQSGALFSIRPGEAPETVARVRTFFGLKPEGIAQTPSGGGIMIVFDTGAGTPQWLELAWPAM